MARTNLTLRGSTYWWRRQVTVGKHRIQLAISLGCGNFNHACLIGTHLSSAVNKLRMAYGELGAAIDRETLRKIFSDAMRWQLRRINSDQAYSPHLAVHHTKMNQIFGELYRILARPEGKLISGDDQRLEEQGWPLSMREALYQEYLRQRSRVQVSQKQLETYCDAFGLNLTKENRASLRRTVLLARAKACEEADRMLLAGEFEPTRWAEDVTREDSFAFDASTGSGENAGKDCVPSPAAPLASTKKSGSSIEEVRATPSEMRIEAAGYDESREGDSAASEQPENRGLTFVEASEQCIAANEEENALSPNTIGQIRTATQLFDYACGGNAYISELTQKDVEAFYKLCRAVPNRWGRTKAEMEGGIYASLQRAQEMALQGRSDAIGISEPTIAKHINFIKKVLDFADDDGSEEGCRPKLALRLKPSRQRIAARAHAKKTRDRDKRANWTPEEVARLLEAPPFHGCGGLERRFELGEHVFHDALYWNSLIILTTGARSSEPGGIPKSHIFEDHEIPHILFQDTPVRKLKTAQSERFLPIPPELIRLGFIDFVKASRKRETEHDLLFPELYSPHSPDFAGAYYRRFEKWRGWAFPKGTSWGHKKGGAFIDKDVHSFRGMASTLMSQADGEVVIDILGHEGKTTKKRVYDDESDLRSKLKAMELLAPLTQSLKRHAVNLLPVNREDGGRRGRKSNK